MKTKLFTRKSMIIAGMIILFIVAVIINVNRNKTEKIGAAKGDDERAAEVISETDYYTAFRNNRDNVRTKEVEYLESIIAAEKTDDETIEEASAQKLDIVECMEVELVIESSIRAKGFNDAAVTFHKGSVNVIVGAVELEEKQVAQILDIVMRETGEPAENIKISVQRNSAENIETNKIPA